MPGIWLLLLASASPDPVPVRDCGLFASICRLNQAANGLIGLACLDAVNLINGARAVRYTWGRGGPGAADCIDEHDCRATTKFIVDKDMTDEKRCCQ